MRGNIRERFSSLARLANESDRARLNSAFAFFSLKRRIIAAVLAVLGLSLLFGVAHGSTGASVKTLVAIHEIASGAVIADSDVTLRDLPIRLIADGSFHARNDVIGQMAVGAIRRGEVITDARVVAPSLLDENGLVAIAVTLHDLANVQLVHAGDRVDVLASQGNSLVADGDTPARTVASNVEVLATRVHDSSGAVILAASSADARAIAGIDGRITLVLRGL